MKNRDNRTTDDAAELRRRAEKIAREKTSQSAENPETLSSAETRRMLHELHVHQIELEMQNTELRRVQVELGAARARYFGLYDLAPVGYCTISERGLVLEANLTAATLLDVARNALVGRPIVRFVIEEDRDIYYLLGKRIFDTGEAQTCELRMAKRDGTTFWAHMAAAPAQDDDGSPVCRVVMSDITERKNSEEALRENEQSRRTLADSGQALIWTAGTDKLCNYFNRVWLEFTGRTLEQEIGNGWTEGVHPDDMHRCLEIYAGAFDRREAFSIEYRLRRHDGEYRWILDDGCPRYDSKGEFSGYIGHCLDITERRQAEEELRLHRDNLEELVAHRTAELEVANRELEAFSYSVSHDLKAPLRAVDGFARILEEDYASLLDDEGRRLLNIIRNSARDMGQLITDLLSFSRMGRTELAMSSLDMEDLVRNVWEKISVLREGRDITLDIGRLPVAYGDMSTIREALVNLLSNAVKFTRLREHAIVSVTGREENGETVYTIRDNGAGFNMAYEDRLFNVFQRLHSAEEFEGTGIGLALVKRIVLRHGGRVRAESKPDEGAAFSFSLPVGRKKE